MSSRKPRKAASRLLQTAVPRGPHVSQDVRSWDPRTKPPSLRSVTPYCSSLPQKCDQETPNLRLLKLAWWRQPESQVQSLQPQSPLLGSSLLIKTLIRGAEGVAPRTECIEHTSRTSFHPLYHRSWGWQCLPEAPHLEGEAGGSEAQGAQGVRGQAGLETLSRERDFNVYFFYDH